MAKKLFVLLIVLLLVGTFILSGCVSKQSAYAEQENDPRLADQNQNAEFLETEEMYYWRGDGCGFLMYYDKASSESGVLCNRPECSHGKSSDPTECGGCILSVGTALSMIAGRLYWVGEYQEGDVYYTSILSMAPDSTDRRLERKLMLPDTVVPQKYFFHHGELYIYSRLSKVDLGTPSYVEALYVTRIDDPEIKTIFERQIPPLERSMMEFKFLGDKIWFFLYGKDENGDAFSNEFFRYDITEGTCETLFSMDGGLSITGFWIDGEDVLLGTVDRETYESGFYRVHEGKPEKIADFEDDEKFFVFPRVSDGIVYATSSGEDPSDISIWIMDHSGNTLYKGALPMGFLGEDKPEAIGFSSDWGDKDGVFFDHEVYYPDGTVRHFLVKYGLADGSLNEELLMNELSEEIG